MVVVKKILRYIKGTRDYGHFFLHDGEYMSFFCENANWMRDFGQMQISHGVDIQAP
jgi:hypothetical protein